MPPKCRRSLDTLEDVLLSHFLNCSSPPSLVFSVFIHRTPSHAYVRYVESFPGVAKAFARERYPSDTILLDDKCIEGTITSAILSVPHHSRSSDLDSLKKKWKSAREMILGQMGSSMDVSYEIIIGNNLSEPVVSLGLHEGTSFLLTYIKGDHTLRDTYTQKHTVVLCVSLLQLRATFRHTVAYNSQIFTVRRAQ